MPLIDNMLIQNQNQVQKSILLITKGCLIFKN